jgi:hypothetical protein
MLFTRIRHSERNARRSREMAQTNTKFAEYLDGEVRKYHGNCVPLLAGSSPAFPRQVSPLLKTAPESGG